MYFGNKYIFIFQFSPKQKNPHRKSGGDESYVSGIGTEISPSSEPQQRQQRPG
jgi:hypothetical protein